MSSTAPLTIRRAVPGDEALLAAVADAGYVRVWLEVARDKAAAKAFYARHGFVPRDRPDTLEQPMPAGHRRG